jgi:hypothetical protein
VSLRVIYEEKAINQAAGFLADDPAGLGAVLDAVDRLADDPRPGRVVPRTGRRACGGCGPAGTGVLDEISGDVVSIGHIARGTASG